MKYRKCILFVFHVQIVTLVNGDDMFAVAKHDLSDGYKIVSSPDRIYDGIGGLSGGGATSRLLVNYPEPQRSQILDYLFKPGFGASLQILKVEIGGDAQSTDGCESSHMHNEHDEPNFHRGYEGWLMTEAKARNPDIQLAALSWAWPGWIGDGTAWPFSNHTKTANYVISWVNGMKSEFGLVINYVGIWNERPYDAEYIKHLRKALDMAGLSAVGIVAADGSWNIAGDMLKDKDLLDAISVVGVHYPGTTSSADAIKTGKRLWASEDYSTFNDNIGAGCWARILNQNYVNGNMTATISWNLIASYYDDLPFKRCSLMTANEPWSGHYEVPAVAWVTAHTTQFVSPGWHYLNSSGHLLKGGSYVAFTDPKFLELTIVIESMSHNNSVCIRPPLPPYEVSAQSVKFNLDGSYKQTITKFNMWTTNLDKTSTSSDVFVKSEVNVVNGSVTIHLEPDQLVTLTTLETGQKGNYGSIPASASFPLPYVDNFDGNGTFMEAFNFADQSGVFELFQSGPSHGKTMRQVVTSRPITWCDDSDSPITLIGDYSWNDVNVTADVLLEESQGVFIALRVDSGGCDVRNAKGLFLWLHSDLSWTLTTTLERNKHMVACYKDWACWKGVRFNGNDWNTLSLAVSNSTVYGYLNSALIFKKSISGPTEVPKNGWAAIGVKTFDYAQFDNFSVKKA